MAGNTPRKFRVWRYLRDGFSTYLSFPVSIINFVVITYYFLVDNIPFLKVLWPHFTYYLVNALVVFIPLAIFLGWMHLRRSRAYQTESLLSTIHNPLVVYDAYIELRALKKIMEKLEIPITTEFLKILDYWKKLYEELSWSPKLA